MRQPVLLFLTALVFSSCVSRQAPRIVSAEKTVTGVDWAGEDFKKDLVIKTLKTTPEASYHGIRLNGAEKPHTHQSHDVAVFVLKGKARLHIGNRIVVVRPGDVIEISRGIVHWAERMGKDSTEVYAIFTPPYDGKDYHEVS